MPRAAAAAAGDADNKRDAATAGLSPMDALHVAAGAPPPPPAVAGAAAAVYGLGTLDLEGLLTHPHLGVLVLALLGDDTAAATALRGTCRGVRDAVAGHAWHDTRARIRWPARWRAAFPAATAANVSREWCGPLSALTDADFVHFRGVRELDMSCCRQATITDGAFAHLAGIHTLFMGRCSQTTITDGAFAHLAGIHTLNMMGCCQATITDGAFAHLAGIHTLDMRDCWQASITPACRAHLRQAGIPDLRM
jgi:hypothetical protein